MPRTYKKNDDVGMQRKAYLGDYIQSALSSVGVTAERVSRWIGTPCGCKERVEKLNALHQWISRVVSGKYKEEEKEIAKTHLDNIMRVDEEDKKDE